MNIDVRSNPEQSYKDNGFAILKVFNQAEQSLIFNHAKAWFRDVMSHNTDKKISDTLDLENYHKWHSQIGVAHSECLRAKFRYIDPVSELKSALLPNVLMKFIKSVSASKGDLWNDPGLGWYGFRLIRPAMNDGYPFSCKNWGQAAGVISVWCPVIGASKNETLALIPGSHMMEHEAYLPDNSKFTKGELRLKRDVNELEIFRPDLDEGEVIVYHPAVLHSEDVYASKITRLNTEYRFRP
jgi:hypothetical protein